LIALGPKPGIVKKLAELHDFYPPARRDSGRHRTEARVGDCWITWAYSIDFRKRIFVCPILTVEGDIILNTEEYTSDGFTGKQLFFSGKKVPVVVKLIDPNTKNYSPALKYGLWFALNIRLQ